MLETPHSMSVESDLTISNFWLHAHIMRAPYYGRAQGGRPAFLEKPQAMY